MNFHPLALLMIAFVCSSCSSRSPLEEQGDPTELLLQFTAPPTWKVSVHHGDVSFAKLNHLGGISAVLTEDPEAELARIRGRQVMSHDTIVKPTTLAGVEAVEVSFKFMNGGTTNWYLLNARRELLKVSLEDAVPPAERRQFLASLRLLPRPPTVKRLIKVSGLVVELRGNCMPPGECPRHRVQRDVVARPILAPNKLGEVVAQTRSDADGRYSFSLAPGVYSLRPIENGAEDCRSSGNLGPCAIRLMNKDIEEDIVINNAVW